jgi:hypothetical protein
MATVSPASSPASWKIADQKGREVGIERAALGFEVPRVVVRAVHSGPINPSRWDPGPSRWGFLPPPAFP